MIREKISDVQSSYDLIADEYARRIYDELQHKPLDCRLLDRLAESIRNVGIACDLGCGPGHIARYLHERGIQVCGIDLSAGMIQRARQLNSGIEFKQGDMRALPVKDNTWAGHRDILRYRKPVARRSCSGVAGDDARPHARRAALAQFPYRRRHVAGRRSLGLWAALEFHFFRVGTVAGFLRSAGFKIEEIIEREPYASEVEYQSRRAYIFAQKTKDEDYLRMTRKFYITTPITT